MLSRVASSLYWMSRYLERVEHTARIVDVNLVLMLDQTPAYADQRWDRLLRSLRVSLPDSTPREPQKIVEALVFDRGTPHSIMSMLTAARDNARQVRNQLSTEMWEQINQLYLEVSRASLADVWGGETHTLLRQIKEGVQLFHGITESTMRQDEGWHFMRVGRFLERADATITLLTTYFSDRDSAEQPGVRRDYLDLVGLLKTQTAFEAYCQVYTADLQADRIAGFLLLSSKFPHSVRFAADRVQIALREIAELTNARKNGPIERVAGRVRATLDYAQIDEIIAADLLEFLRDIQRQSDQIHALLQQSYFQPPLQAVLAS